MDKTLDKTLDNYFDWRFYISNYKDLQKAGIKTAEHAREHYETHGKREKRLINEAQLHLSKRNFCEFMANIKTIME